MKVGSLFAEIGFKVDQSGLEQFSNAMKAFQKTIKSGLKELKEYARAAREISNAMKNAYIPNQQEARARFRATTRYISSQAKGSNASSRYTRAQATNLAAQANLYNERARLLEEQTRIRASNARSRAEQIRLKKMGMIGTHDGRGRSRIEASLAAIASMGFGNVFGTIGTGIGGLIGGPAGSAMGAVIGGLLDKLISTIWSAVKWLGNTVLSGIKFGLAYRDYRAFTGRSARGLSDVMYGALSTTKLSPEDILKDAAALETNFWDMFFGGGNPRAWQAMGIVPTGVGETDLKNILASVGSLSQPGLRRKMLKEFGLSEEYEVLMQALKRESPDKDWWEIIDNIVEREEDVTKANLAIRSFTYELEAIKLKFVEAFVKSGLSDKLKELAPIIDKIVSKIKPLMDLAFDTIKKFLVWLNGWLGEKIMTPEQKAEYEKLDSVTKGGREAFYKQLPWLSGHFAGKSLSSVDNWMKYLNLRPGSDADKIAYVQDEYKITISSPEELDTVFDKIQQRKDDILNSSLSGDSYNGTAQYTPTA